MADPLYGTLLDDNSSGNYNRGQQGVFGLNPLATPKYSRNNGLRDAEYKETLARMYVSLADADNGTKDAYLASLPGDAQIQALAKVLIGYGQKGGTGFIDFFLTQANETFQEVRQVDKVLGDNYVAFYFGQEPPVFQYSGMLLNSMQDDQRSGFALAYQHLLRGTQLARRGAVLRLRYDSVIVSGTVDMMQQSLNAENEMAVPFSFAMLVKEYVVLRNPRFTKTTQQEFVQLATQFANVALTPVGAASDVRVRSTLVQPTTLSQDPAVPSQPEDDPDEPPASIAATPQQLNDRIAKQTQQVARPPLDIIGTVSTTPNPPPSPTIPNSKFNQGP